MSAPYKPLDQMSESELIAALKDPHWRLRNLYWITDKDGNAVRFRPWEEQEKFYKNLWFRNLVPKARQRGFSTAVQIMMLDAALFVPNTAAAIIAQDDQIAKTIFQKKIKFAWNRLPPLVREMVGTPTRDNEHELAWATDSTIIVATSTRGNTLQYLHISEFGQICAKYPDRADEIMEGSLPSVDQGGVVVIESTVESPFGHFSDMVRTAEKVEQLGRPLNPMEYRLHFASWWDADEYETDPADIIVSSIDHAYFNRLEAEIRRDIGPRKRAWYVAKRDNDFGGSVEKMNRQYPSTLKEAFTVSTDGMWLGGVMATARRQHRITKVPFDPAYPVDTYWDLGIDDDQAIWLGQDISSVRMHWIDFLEASSEPPSFYWRTLNEKAQKRGFTWGRHYLPHDADKRHPGAEQLQTQREMLEGIGMKNIIVVPRIANVVTGIEQMREAFPTYYFDEEHCKEGLESLDGFSKTWDQKRGVWQDIISKNGCQHAADALRQHGQHRHNARPQGRSIPNRKNRSGMAA